MRVSVEIPQLPYASRITLKCIFYSGSFSLPPRSNLIAKASCVDFLLPSTSPTSFPCNSHQCFLEFSARYGIAFQDVFQSPSRETQIKTLIFPSNFSFPSTDFFFPTVAPNFLNLFSGILLLLFPAVHKDEGAGGKGRSFVCLSQPGHQSHVFLGDQDKQSHFGRCSWALSVYCVAQTQSNGSKLQVSPIIMTPNAHFSETNNLCFTSRCT